MPSSACSARIARCWNRGCSSIWLTAGTTPVASMIRSSVSGVKFDTPIERARPSSRSRTSAFQVST